MGAGEGTPKNVWPAAKPMSSSPSASRSESTPAKAALLACAVGALPALRSANDTSFERRDGASAIVRVEMGTLRWTRVDDVESGRRRVSRVARVGLPHPWTCAS